MTAATLGFVELLDEEPEDPEEPDEHPARASARATAGTVMNTARVFEASLLNMSILGGFGAPLRAGHLKLTGLLTFVNTKVTGL
jgi:hypothetical protein